MAKATAIHCPYCGKGFKANPKMFGKKTRCKGCEEIFVVEPPEEFEEEEETSVQSASKKRASSSVRTSKVSSGILPEDEPEEDDDDDEGGDPYGVTTLDLTPRCPNCANPLESEESIICLYCGYNTQTRTWGKTKQVYESTGQDYFLWWLPAFMSLFAIILMMLVILWYCVVVPRVPWVVGSQYYNWMIHESLRMWSVMILLSIMWGLGLFVYNRLIVNPIPPEKEKK
ncbi:MAG: hypothetical protein ACFCD0_04835 [Gemmataceae bacterium]